MHPALPLVPEIELHEFHAKDIALARFFHQFADGVDIAGSRHADIDLAEQSDVGSCLLHEPSDGRPILQALRVQGSKPQAHGPGAERGRRGQLDLIEGRELPEKSSLPLPSKGGQARLRQEPGIRCGEFRHGFVDHGAHEGPGRFRIKGMQGSSGVLMQRSFTGIF